MEMISLPVSPFSARVRIGIYAKGLDVTIASPPVDWPQSAHYRTINPTGRVPVLICEDGTVIPESEVILEYLEERFQNTARLLPSAPVDRAKVRLLSRVVDLYLMPPVVALARPGTDEKAIRAKLSELLDALRILDGLLGTGTYSVGDELTLADCALAPALFAVEVTGNRLGIELLAGNDLIEPYAAAVQRDEHVRRVVLEMADGLRQLERPVI
jgi:glutathione S-transferase